MALTARSLVLCIIAIFLPPLPVFLRAGCTSIFWMNVLLTILLWIPGVIHAWYVITGGRAFRRTPGPHVGVSVGTGTHHHHRRRRRFY